ncbi:MAG: glycosyltransferase [Actinomycetaceae bacterium]|nr:glycosyltransferase [Actinomycetaceae bacterium]MDY5273917.1 glycosyltransferase [Arcanobacterium sp.]
MKIAYVTAWYPTSASPYTAPFVERDVMALSQIHDVRVLHIDRSFSGREKLVRGGVLIERVGARSIVDILRLPAQIRAFSKRADIVHSAGAFALLVLAVSGVPRPWVHTEHWSQYLRRSTLTAVLAQFERCPDQVLAVSSVLAQALERYGAKNVAVVPNIVVAAEKPPERDWSRGIAIISIGALIDGKGPLDAIETVRVLREQGYQVSLTWVGAGLLMEECVATAQGLPIRFVGAVPPEQIPQYLAQANIFLLPTKAETFCLAAAEALASGIGVVMGANGGQRDFVRPPFGALVEDPTDAGALAEAVLQVVDATRAATPADVASTVAPFSAQEFQTRMDAIYHRIFSPCA